jgi:2-polyprenyl-3-methyl-5-hydroxy-6-metoxy-1,4-benzoquinol methylase
MLSGRKEQMMTTAEQAASEIDEQAVEALAGRLFQMGLGAFEYFTVYLGDRLGYYRALAGEAATPAELAARTGTNERYAREWLEQQAVAGLIDVAGSDSVPAARRYSLSPAAALVFVDRGSPAYLAPLSRYGGSLSLVLPALLEAFRTGGGVSWADYGADAREAQGDFNRNAFLGRLASEWLPALPDTYRRLHAGEALRIADVGCGVGWSSIAMATAFPAVQVDGFDLDAPSLELARAHAAGAGLTDRARFHERDAADPALAGQYDLVTAFECIHDLARPVEVLRSMRRMLAPGGTVLVMDERAAEQFTAPGDEIERFLYSASVLCCLPTGMAEQPSAGTGTVMRPDTLRRYALEAGFRELEVLPIEDMMFRFYRLHA